MQMRCYIKHKVSCMQTLGDRKVIVKRFNLIQTQHKNIEVLN